MRAKRTSIEDQLRLVTECRQSGLTDAQWCQENGINISSFYNWTSRLRKAGTELPSSSGSSRVLKQDIVRIDIADSCNSPQIQSGLIRPDSNVISPTGNEMKEVKYPHPVMELSIGEISLKISENVSASYLASLLIALKEQSC